MRVNYVETLEEALVSPFPVQYTYKDHVWQMEWDMVEGERFLWIHRPGHSGIRLYRGVPKPGNVALYKELMEKYVP